MRVENPLKFIIAVITCFLVHSLTDHFSGRRLEIKKLAFIIIIFFNSSIANAKQADKLFYEW